MHLLGEFAQAVQATDEVAVEVTGNTRLFLRGLEERGEGGGGQPHQFQVIRRSVKKTDAHDARTLALFWRRTCCRRCA